VKSRKRQLAIPQRVMDRMIDIAWSAYPQEAVGLLGGVRRDVRSVYGLRNRASGREFFADAYSQYQAMRKIELARERLIATFHSHPEGSVTLSDTDRRYVFEVAETAIVIALSAAGHSAHVAAFTRTANGFEDSTDIVVRA